MLDDAERTLKAAADPVRARILKMLEGGEMCVCQVVAVLGLPQSTVSRHLSALKGAQLVRERRVRKWVHYSLCSSLPPGRRRFLRALLAWLEDDPQVARDRERTGMARQMGAAMVTALGRRLPEKAKQALTGGRTPRGKRCERC